MADDGDGRTSVLEAVVVSVLFVAGATFLLKPAVLTAGLFFDFLDAFPDPSALGPYGAVFAMAALIAGGGGWVRKLRR